MVSAQIPDFKKPAIYAGYVGLCRDFQEFLSITLYSDFLEIPTLPYMSRCLCGEQKTLAQAYCASRELAKTSAEYISVPKDLEKRVGEILQLAAMTEKERAEL